MSEDKEKTSSSEDLYEQIKITHTFEMEDDFLNDISESLKQQVNEEMNQIDNQNKSDEGTGMKKGKPKKRHIGIKITGAIILALFAVIIFFVGTKPGRKMLYDWGSRIVAGRMDNQGTNQNSNDELFTKPTIIVGEENIDPDLRREDYVANFLVFGIEEIGGGGRTDTMMIASVNIKDKSIKLTSIMRDCYVEIEGHDSNKLNAAYALGGADLLVDTIEKNFKIHIDGYASVNFESFERIVDMLGGVDIELGSAEANYLNTTNYISNPSYRNVSAGWNTLNGNQALGYARVRKVVTLGGANNDFGRTLRQRRLLNAIFDKYKSKSMIELVTIMYDILPEIKTNLSSTQISDVLEQIIENGITTIDNYRIPAEGFYTDGRNEHGYVLLLDFEGNIKEMYKNIFLDVEEPTVVPSMEGEPTVEPIN